MSAQGTVAFTMGQTDAHLFFDQQPLFRPGSMSRVSSGETSINSPPEKLHNALLPRTALPGLVVVSGGGWVLGMLSLIGWALLVGGAGTVDELEAGVCHKNGIGVAVNIAGVVWRRGENGDLPKERRSGAIFTMAVRFGR